MAVCSAKAYDEQVGILAVAQHFQIGHGNILNLLRTLAGHQVVVLGIGTDDTCLVVLFQSAQDVGEALAARHSPVAGSVLGTHIGCPLAQEFLGHIGRIDFGILGQIGQFERSRTVGHVSIGKQHHGCHVFQSHL